MHYYVEYSVCALIFLMVITVRFFAVRRFPNVQNHLFGIILWCAIVDLTLDIAGSITIEYAAAIPAWVNYVINTPFYILQAAFPAIMVVYVLVLRDGSLKISKSMRLLAIPFIISELLLLTNLFTKLIFYVPLVNGEHAYVRGPLFNVIYITGAFYLASTLIIALKYRETRLEKQFSSIVSFLFIIVTAIIIQFFYPQFLLTGVAITISIMMMYFNIQNPEDMLDLISGVFNYTAMLEFLSIRISKSRQLWLVAADVGGIRRINSAFGVSAGNEIFAEVGKYFNSLEGGAWPFRMFGTRFLIIADSAEGYQRTIEEIEERFSEPWRLRENEVTLSVTIRYFSEWDFFKSPEDVVNLIDVAFSEIGAEGWGIKKRISTELLIMEKRRLVVENRIREALKTGSGFSLHFQPIYSPGDQSFTHVEALLRLNCAECEGVQPSEFIRVAEKTGLILQIDELVIRMACDFLIRNANRLHGLLTRLNINLSAAEFYNNPSARIESLIRGYRISPDLLCFEVTETAATSHPGTLAGFMSDMKSRGYHFALDDFGTGYANLSRVIELPFETVKLDRSLLLPQNERSGKLFANVLNMFSQIGISTVVEGVETVEQAERVRLLGADMAQGFYYARPMTEEALISFLRDQSR